MRKILFGTRNKTRKEYVKEILSDLDLEILGLDDFGISNKIREDTNSEKENSLSKALGYYKESGIPTFSIDAGLYIDSFPVDRQPGAFVRRIFEDLKEATDEEMLQYYITELKKYGRTSKGRWKIALTLVVSLEEIYTTTFEKETLFTVEKCISKTEGEPLNSIQIDFKTGRYEAELSAYERKQSQQELSGHIIEFIHKHL